MPASDYKDMRDIAAHIIDVLRKEPNLNTSALMRHAKLHNRDLVVRTLRWLIGVKWVIAIKANKPSGERDEGDAGQREVYRLNGEIFNLPKPNARDERCRNACLSADFCPDCTRKPLYDNIEVSQ